MYSYGLEPRVFVRPSMLCSLILIHIRLDDSLQISSCLVNYATKLYISTGDLIVMDNMRSLHYCYLCLLAEPNEKDMS